MNQMGAPLLGPIGITEYLVVSVWMLACGLYCVFTRRNAVALLMGVELILNAAALNFVAFARFGVGRVDGHVSAIFVIALGAAEAAVALAIVLALFRLTASIRADEASRLRG